MNLEGVKGARLNDSTRSKGNVFHANGAPA